MWLWRGCLEAVLCKRASSLTHHAGERRHILYIKILRVVARQLMKKREDEEMKWNEGREMRREGRSSYLNCERT